MMPDARGRSPTGPGSLFHRTQRSGRRALPPWRALPDAKGVWHKHGVTAPARPRPPLDDRQLEELALRYVGRFATSRKRLADYLRRKLKERGWTGAGEPPVDAVVERLGKLGYVDDAAYALARSRSLGARGYGPRRLSGALLAAGIGDEDRQAAMESSAEARGEAILRFARRRRIGPFADAPADRALREKWIAALVRAGHDFTLARKVACCAPGAPPQPGDLLD